ncbi:MAG: glycosyltransferase family 2 protein [Acidobacteria bacterium]|nr:glycosyltransferase family 2 protein [Acidobacteriota bacterium]
MKLSVIVPIYNERSTIETVLDRLATLPGDKEVIVVDDGSTDGSRQYLEERAARGEPGGHRLRVIVHPTNRGKGSAIITALDHVEGDAVIIQDADLEYDPAEIPALLEALARGDAQVVYGSRFLGSIRGMWWSHWLANRILTLTTNLLYGSHLTDEATGYKLFRRDVLEGLGLTCRRFEFCPEVTAKVLKKGHTILEVPLHAYMARHLDKKISWTDGFAAFWVLVRERFRA